MWPLAVLTGDRINEGFFTRNCMALLPGQKNAGRNNEVTVLPRGLKAGFHCTCKLLEG